MKAGPDSALIDDFTLSVEPPLTTVSPGPRAAEGLSVASVRLPAIADRQQIVVRTGPQTVDVREFDRWAEPLDLMTQRTLSADLALRGGRRQRVVDSPTTPGCHENPAA
ncbi:MAG TPA: ABC-type transport auxiliary lipoprotein family protein [Aliidongia sp.]|nr:ABC-type transport auxiliary lipoprotein family protein [Aliidongia sp.]